MAAPTLRGWLRICGADGASGHAEEGLRLLSSPRTATGQVSEQKEESRGGPEGGKERSPKTEQEANTAFNTFSKSSLSLFSTLALPHESRFPPVLGVLECPFQRNYFFPKVLLLSSKLPLLCTENIVKTHFVKVIRMS